MQLLKLEVQNWVHHRKKSCEFTRGLVAILGENGSGKSSLFGAISWALTGENPNAGTKIENVSQYAKDGEPAFVRLTFEHNGHIAVVTRWLRPEKETSTLVVDDVETDRGDRATTAGIEKLLGIDAKFISRFIIVGQLDIFSFIDQRQSEVDTFFQHLFGTAVANKCQAAIGEVLPLAQPPEIAKTSGEIALLQLALDEQIDAAQKRVDAIPTIDSFLKMQQADQEIAAQWQAREKLTLELVQIEQRAAEYDRALAGDDEQIAQYTTDLANLSGVGGKDADYSAAKTALAHWSNYKKIAARQAAIAEERAEILTQLDSDAVPPTITQDELDLFNRACHRLQHDLSCAEAFVAVFSEDGAVECPTCHTPTSNLTEQIHETQRLIPILQQQLAEANVKYEQAQNDIAAYRAWEKRDQVRSIREQELQKLALDLVAVTPPAADELALQQTVGDYEEMVAAKTDIAEMLQKLKEHRAQLAGVSETIAFRRTELLEAINNISTTKADAHLAQTRIEKLKEQCALRQTLDRECEELRFNYRQLSEQRVASQQKEQEAERLKNWVTLATQVRDAFKSAPRLVATRNLQKLETAINEILQIFSVNFLVRASDDGTPSFIAEFYDGRKQSAQRLSVGQKTVLALAFRVACNAMFAEEIGLLALDEPTAALDAVRIRALAPVLEKLRELSTAKGLQCLLVTHASSLSHLFESTVELDAPETRHVEISG